MGKTNEWAAKSLRELHRTLCYERGDHPDEIDTAASLGADALLRVSALAAEKKALEALVECPLSLEDRSELCSAGTCVTCLVKRLAAAEAQKEALERERDALREQVRMNSFMGEGYVFVEQRAKAAEARIARLEEAMLTIRNDRAKVVRVADARYIANAALTQEDGGGTMLMPGDPAEHAARVLLEFCCDPWEGDKRSDAWRNMNWQSLYKAMNEDEGDLPAMVVTWLEALANSDARAALTQE